MLQRNTTQSDGKTTTGQAQATQTTDNTLVFQNMATHGTDYADWFHIQNLDTSMHNNRIGTPPPHHTAPTHQTNALHPHGKDNN